MEINAFQRGARGIGHEGHNGIRYTLSAQEALDERRLPEFRF